MSENATFDLDAEITALESRREKLLLLWRLRKQVGEMESGRLEGPNSKMVFDIIVQAVCERFVVDVASLMSKRRTETIARPRQVIFFLCRELTAMSLQEIGRMFGKDHGTVLHGCRAVKDIMDTDRAFAASVNFLQSLCGKRMAGEDALLPPLPDKSRREVPA